MTDRHANFNSTPPPALNRIRVLGYAGLIPFVAALLAHVGAVPGLPWTPLGVFVAYGAVILSFMAGVLWGRTLHDVAAGPDTRLLLGSNAFALLGWLALGLAQISPVAALGLLALGFVGVWLLEEWRAPATPPGLATSYRKLRLRLTGVVLILHAAMATSFWLGA